jgi:pantetheine-phosphate adenylyltransferase
MGSMLYPGSFDPITNGHLDIIRRASRLFDSIVVGVASNAEKNPLFSVEERMALLREACEGYPHISVACFDGLLVDALRKFDAKGVIRGLRAVSDFEYEFQMALMNRELNPNYETLFLMPSPEYSFVSSRMIKEIARFGGDIAPFVPPPVLAAIKKKFGRA